MVFFKTREFEFEARRVLWYCPRGGSDFAEVENICQQIKDGNYESWYRSWKNGAEKLLKRTQRYSSKISRGHAFLRASRYFQASEFFLSPLDKRKIDVYQLSVQYFYEGLKMLEIPYRLEMIPYENISLRSLYFTHKTATCKGTLFICGGFDALLEELYFTNVVAGIEEGYNVIIFEGPGQSSVLREHHLPFIPNWEKVCQAVINYYENQVSKPFIGIGLSLGGLLMARAQGNKNDLFDSIVLYNYFPSVLESFKNSIPQILHRFIDDEIPSFVEKLAMFYIQRNKFLNWQVEQAKWNFGEPSLSSLIKRCKEFKEITISGPVLVLLSTNDMYYDKQLGFKYFEAIPSKEKKLIIFDKENYSSDLHCQNGSAFDSNDEIFEWLSEIELP